MVLPGIQALFGFQLISIFSDGFKQLDGSARGLHFGALLCSALAVMLVMTPAAFHRIAESEQPSGFFMQMSSALIAIAMAILLLGLSSEMWVIAIAVSGSTFIAAASSLAILIVGALLWFVGPFTRRKLKRR